MADDAFKKYEVLTKARPTFVGGFVYHGTVTAINAVHAATNARHTYGESLSETFLIRSEQGGITVFRTVDGDSVRFQIT